ncbi:MAG: alpha/beta hydrolase [Hyphomonas sp.]
MLHIQDKVEEIEREGAATVSLDGRPFRIKRQFLDDLSRQNVLDHVRDLKKPLLIMHAPRDQVVGIENAERLFVAARHPKSFVSLDTADHLLSDPADARYAGEVLAAWASRYAFAEETARPQSGSNTALPTGDDARAVSIDGERFAVALSIGDYHLISDVSLDEGGRDLGPNPTRILKRPLPPAA